MENDDDETWIMLAAHTRDVVTWLHMIKMLSDEESRSATEAEEPTESDERASATVR